MIMCIENPFSSTNLYCIPISHVIGLFSNSILTKWVENICIDFQCLYGLQLMVPAETSIYNDRKSDGNDSDSKWAIGEV